MLVYNAKTGTQYYGDITEIEELEAFNPPLDPQVETKNFRRGDELTHDGIALKIIDIHLRYFPKYKDSHYSNFEVKIYVEEI